MPKVRFEVRDASSDYADRCELIVFVDGVEIGGGWYGSEPEDNSRHRHYSWVEELLEKLAKKLGAEVSFDYIELKDKF